MREDYSDKYKFDLLEEEPESASRLALWIWPVLGMVAIAVIVITTLRSPWLLNKVGITPGTPVEMAAKPVAPQTAPPAKPVKKEVPVKAPGKTEPSSPDLANLRGEKTRIADTLKAINSTLQKQNTRIRKLESIVGTVTGSVPGARDATPSSIRPKTEKVRTENQVNTAQKTDLLTISTGKAKRIGEGAILASPIPPHQDTQEARAKPVGKKQAAPNTSNIPRPAPLPSTKATSPAKHTEPKVQYAVKLARARTRARLAVEWERLIRGKASELSVLEPQIMPATTKKGEKVLDLVAGPFNHMADAIELCARLKLEGIKCKQSRYGGKPL
jgi:hypothetical protein